MITSIPLTLETILKISELTGESYDELDCKRLFALEHNETVIYHIQIWSERKPNAPKANRAAGDPP